jgi:hypothetical protein
LIYSKNVKFTSSASWNALNTSYGKQANKSITNQLFKYVFLIRFGSDITSPDSWEEKYDEINEKKRSLFYFFTCVNICCMKI